MSGVQLPRDFEAQLGIGVANAQERLEEASEVAEKLARGGVPLLPTADHFALFVDPPRLLAGPLKRLGYVVGMDNRCYPSPVDGHEYINVAASLPQSSFLRRQGWPDHIAVVHPVDDEAFDHMLAQNYGNPFVHHITFGIALPELRDARSLMRHMMEVRERVEQIVGAPAGRLIMALPAAVIRTPGFGEYARSWLEPLAPPDYQLEEMEGGGFLLQFFVLQGGRLEVALRWGTRQAFNPKSVQTISAEELSVDQGPGG